MEKAKVSIVIPAYNEEGVIGKLIKSIKKQSYKNIEIIVVDDASTDQTAQISKKFGAKVFKRTHAERSVQRNFGAKKSNGDYLLFLDADMQLSKDVVKACIKVVDQDNKIGAVVIPEKSVAKTFWEKVKAYERSFYNEAGDETTDAARFFPEKVFWKIGGYDESITGPEDWDLPETIKKSGFRVERISPLIYHHERIKNIFSLMKKKYYYGLKSFNYLKKQNLSPVSAKTIYFLRPVFYKNWKKLFANPTMSISMFVMLFLENLSGGLGYIKGRING